MKRFSLDAGQTDAILELKMYRLARLEILVIQQELAERRKRARDIGALLKSKVDLWKIIRDEIEEIAEEIRRHAAHARSRRPSRRPNTRPTTSSSTKRTS